MRKSLLPFAQNLVGDFQFGSGLNGGETAFPHLYIRLIHDYLTNNRIPGALIFVDVTTAFASLLRRILFDTEQGDEAWYRKLHDSGFTHNDIADIRDFMLEVFDDHLGVDPPPQLPYTYMHNQYTNTWFTNEYIPHAVHTTRGSMAGMTMADVMYSMSFAKVLKVLVNSLRNKGLIPTVNAHTSFELLPAAFFDDVVISIISTHCNKVIHDSMCVADIIITVFNMFGLTVNMKPGKTASMPLLCGPGLKKVMLTLQESQYVIQSSPESANQFSLIFSKTYKHMGTKYSAYFGMAEEVSTRCAIMRSGIRQYSKIFQNILEYSKIF